MHDPFLVMNVLWAISFYAPSHIKPHWATPSNTEPTPDPQWRTPSYTESHSATPNHNM